MRRPQLFSLCLLAVFWPALALRPAPQEPLPEAPPLQVDVQLVNVEVAVTDPEGNFVSHLAPENFRLLEDGRRQALVHFTPTRAPVRIALLVESSPTVFLIRYDYLAAAGQLLARLRPEDEVALVTYARAPRSQVGFTRDKVLVEKQLHALGSFGLGMADVRLLDAVAQLLAWLTPPPQRTAALIIGTGLDSGSRTPWTSLEPRLGAGQVTFFAVATGRLLRNEPEEGKRGRRAAAPSEADASFAAADARLRALAAASAGEAYFPESPAELEDIYRRIGERLRNLYSLGYYPTNRARDGAYREIRVELVDETGAPLTLRDARGRTFTPRLFARPGYFAATE